MKELKNFRKYLTESTGEVFAATFKGTGGDSVRAIFTSSELAQEFIDQEVASNSFLENDDFYIKPYTLNSSD